MATQRMVEKFTAEILDGHKGAAVEVPFDPTITWSLPVRPLWRGRRGHAVNGTVNGVSFQSAIVPRSRRFYLLLDEGVLHAAELSLGATATFSVTPLAAAEQRQPKVSRRQR